MRKLTEKLIHEAMLTSLEGYKMAVCDSIEHQLERELTDKETHMVSEAVKSVIVEITHETGVV